MKFFVLALLATASCGMPDAVTATAAPLTGKWLLKLSSNDVGTVRMVMQFNATDSTFSAATRPNADRDVLGSWKSFLARTFTPDFKNGSLMRVVNGKVTHRTDSLLLRGVCTSAMGNYYFIGSMVGDTLKATLSDGLHEKRGEFSGVAYTGSGPLADYPALIDSALAKADEQLYDPKLVTSKEYRQFKKRIRKIATVTQDDLELVFAFFSEARSLPFSHFALMRPLPGPAEEAASPPGQVELEERSPALAVLRIKSFSGSAAEMDSIFTVIQARGYSKLIVDLRDNPGGTVAAGLSFATHVADTTMDGGLFLTRRWWSTHDGLPTAEEMKALPKFSKANFDLIISGIHHEEGLHLVVVPEAPHYGGELFILTNSRTASTCEPLVYGLKATHRAVVIGETTAGAMLNGEFFPVGDGFQLIVPTADYYTADGIRLDHRGVEPDIEVKSDKALDAALERAKQ
jgi:hypothetical protein